MLNQPTSKGVYPPSRYARVPWQKSPLHMVMVAFSICYVCYLGRVMSKVCDMNHEAIKASPYFREPWWIFAQFGSKGIDMSDVQWRTVSDNALILLFVMLLLVGVSRYIRSVCPANNKGQAPLERNVESGILELSSFMSKVSPGHTPLAIFHCIAGLVFVCSLHGPRVLFMFFFTLVNFFVIAPLCKHLPPKVWLALLWVYHIGVLFLNESFDGYRIASFMGPNFAWIDALPQLLRWNVVFNMSTLRMIAYCIDYEEAVHRGGHELRTRLEEKHRTNCTECVSRKCACYKLRTETSRPMAEYNLVHYLAYLFYVPLYVAGPMSSFNAYVSHVYSPQRWFKNKDALRYAGRLVSYFASIFIILHFQHVLLLRHIPTASALALEKGIDMRFGMFLFTLAFLWLKFSIIWKVFRLVSLLDGFDVPEDMLRCFAGATTIANFWRDWHASFNIWIIRYMYIPLGGNKLKAFAIVPIFLFIAIWHDIQLQLLSWAFLVCLVFVPETIVISYFSSKKYDWLRERPYYFLFRAWGSCLTICSLILSNLVGYGTGHSSTEHAKGMLADISTDALIILIGLPLCFSHVNWRSRDVAYEAERRLRWELGLPIDLNENLKSAGQLSFVA